MCQAYEGEQRWVIAIEQREHANGKPYTCAVVEGMFSCDSRQFQTVFRYPENEKGWGWECCKCGQFYKSKENDKGESK